MFTKEKIAGDRSIYYQKLPVEAAGNVFLNGADPAGVDPSAEVISGKVLFRITEENGKWFLDTDLYKRLTPGKREIMTTDILGMAFEPEQRFEQSDGSDLRLDTDLNGQPRSGSPAAGPMEYGEIPVRIPLHL